MGDIRVTIRKDSNQENEVVIAGDRDDLRYQEEICLNLSQITDEDVRTGNNHYHIADYLGNAEEGSVPLIIRCTATSAG